METAKPAHTSKISKLDVYLGYAAAGQLKLQKIRAYATSHEISISALVLYALQKTFPDIGL